MLGSADRKEFTSPSEANGNNVILYSKLSKMRFIKFLNRFIPVLYIWSPGGAMRKIIMLIRAHGLLNRAHGLLSRAHGLVICAHGLP